MPKLKLNYHNLFDQVWSAMKTKKENDITDCIGVVHAENETELLWSLWPGVLYDENQME